MEILLGATATLRFPEPGADAAVFEEEPLLDLIASDGTKVLTEEETHKAEEDGLTYYTAEIEGLADLDVLTARWTGKTAPELTATYETRVEVVGGFVVPLKAIEAKLGEARDLGDLERARELALNEIEGSCGIAFRPRFRTEQIRGSGRSRLSLGTREVTELRSVSVGEEELSETELGDLELLPLGFIDGRYWPSNQIVKVGMIHGYSFYPSAHTPVRDYAAYLLAEQPSDWQGRATSFTNEFGATYSLVTPGIRGADFPLPSVNAFCQRHTPALVA